MAGPLKNYDVSGKDLGDGRPAPNGTVLRLTREHAERLGLEKSTKKRDADAEPKTSSTPDVATKPRTAPTRKRTTRRR